MSTILDALRKVEETHRTRSADTRARLLAFPTRPSTYSSRQRRTPWLIGGGLALIGFTAGAGLMLWGPRLPAPEESQIANATGGDIPPDKQVNPPEPLAQPTPRPAGQAPTQSLAQPRSPATAEIPPNSAPATLMPQRLIPEQPRTLTPAERRAARREAHNARQATLRSTPPANVRDLVTATKAAQPQLQPQPLPELREESAQPVATVPRTAAPRTKSPVPAPAATTVPPNTSLSFLQWSPEPDRRLAFIKVDGGPLTLAHEGDTVAGYTVVEIRRDAVELSAKGLSFTLQVGP
jgi:hypothetical protein